MARAVLSSRNDVHETLLNPSEGIMHVLVGGTAVVRDGQLVEGVFPGRAITRSP